MNMKIIRKLTPEQAKAQGYIVDQCTYPHYGYKEPRDGHDYCYVYTPLESEMIGLLSEFQMAWEACRCYPYTNKDIETIHEAYNNAMIFLGKL